MAGLGEHDEAESASERARSADCAGGIGDGSGREGDGRKSVNDIGRPFSIGHREFRTSRGGYMPSSAPT